MSFISLPISEQWCDMTTGSPVGTNQHQMDGSILKVVGEEADIDHIPIYVRAGSFIPMSKRIMSTEEYDPKNVVIHFYYTNDLRESQGFWYEDDGVTAQAYEKGMYFKQFFTFSRKCGKKRIQIILDDGENNSVKAPKTQLKILNSSSSPRKVKINGKKIEFQYDQNNHYLIIDTRKYKFSYPLEISWR